MGTNISVEITASNDRINYEGSLSSFGTLLVAYVITRGHILECQNKNIFRYENTCPHVDNPASVGENIWDVEMCQWAKASL
jgi:hypothetical protein